MTQESPSTVDAEAEAHDEQVERIEILISRLLLWGVLASFVLVVAGTTVSFVHRPDYFRSREGSESTDQSRGGGAAFAQGRGAGADAFFRGTRSWRWGCCS